jgi:hypothetical protein
MRYFEYIATEKASEIIEKAKTISIKIQKFINYLKKTEFKGTKYKS